MILLIQSKLGWLFLQWSETSTLWRIQNKYFFSWESRKYSLVFQKGLWKSDYIGSGCGIEIRTDPWGLYEKGGTDKCAPCVSLMGDPSSPHSVWYAASAFIRLQTNGDAWVWTVSQNKPFLYELFLPLNWCGDEMVT